MKIYGIFRGFAGLGRVVAGMGIVNRLRSEGHEVRIFTYAQGLTISEKYGFSCDLVKGEKDIGFMGIIPISPTGLSIFDDISKWQPDCVIIDGEPLMIDCLRSSGLNTKIIALTNPLDLYSKNNNPVTMNFFRHLFSQSDYIFSHGLQNIESYLPENMRGKVFCMNTILRDEILSIKHRTNKYINCILGGGTKNCAADFLLSTIEIARRVILIAKIKPDLMFNIYCNDKNIGKRIEDICDLQNVKIITDYVSPVDIYCNSRLVIARAGRNTLSELLYLKIPAIAISILGNVVSIEQRQNIKIASQISNKNIVGHNLNDDQSEFIKIFN